MEPHRCIDKGITVHLSIAHEFRIFEAGNQAEDLFLFRPFDISLKADEIIECTGEIILTKLDDGVRTATRTRIDKADRTHWSERKRVMPTRSNLLNRQAAFEEMLILALKITEFD